MPDEDGRIGAWHAGIGSCTTSVPMADIVDELQRAVDQKDGGATVVWWSVGNADEGVRQVAKWCVAAGFIPIATPPQIDATMPASLRHRHLLLICESAASVETTIRWVRALARTSPRRHVVVSGWRPGSLDPGNGAGVAGSKDPALQRSEWRPESLDPGPDERERRALRWQRRGRSRISDRWLAAASEAARRRGDVERAIGIDLNLIKSLIDHGRLDEARRRLHQYLSPSTAWLLYARAAALHTDILISRTEWPAAVAWINSVTAEANLRGDVLPVSMATRISEVDFWLSRPVQSPDLSLPIEIDRLAWCALRMLSGGDRDAAAPFLERLGDESGRAAHALVFWPHVFDVLNAPPSGRADFSQAALRLAEMARQADLPVRRARLAIAVAARALLLAGKQNEARSLLNAGRGLGPEDHVCRHLADEDEVRGRRTKPGGIEWLSSWRNPMHLVDGLPSLLSVFEEADDEHNVLTGSCRWLCQRGGAVRAAIVSADGSQFLVADGWRPVDLAGPIGGVARDSARDIRLCPDNRDAIFTVSIRSLGATIGSLVVLGRSGELETLHQSALTVATLVGPAVRARLDAIAATTRARHDIAEIVGDSPLMVALRNAIARAAASPFPVLIEGESGTGKELVARALHRLSARRDRKLSAVNCAALTDELVEAELFGHIKGAFTGAIGPRVGLFEESHGGTLFLDEVTELSPRAQAKLLRVLQEREIRRVGENQSRAVDVRMIAACNIPIGEAVAIGRFRDDLRFRLAVIPIALPPLRDRVEDIPALALAFWRRSATEAGTRAMMGPDALTRLTHHSWPGNVRELQNVIAGLVVAAPLRGRVTARHVEQVLTHAAPVLEMPGIKLDIARRTFERRIILAALTRHAGRRHAAAAELGLTRQGLAKALRRLGLATGELLEGVA